jgi:hypothetical protein
MEVASTLAYYDSIKNMAVISCIVQAPPTGQYKRKGKSLDLKIRMNVFQSLQNVHYGHCYKTFWQIFVIFYFLSTSAAAAPGYKNTMVIYHGKLLQLKNYFSRVKIPQ